MTSCRGKVSLKISRLSATLKHSVRLTPATRKNVEVGTDLISKDQIRAIVTYVGPALVDYTVTYGDGYTEDRKMKWRSFEGLFYVVP